MITIYIPQLVFIIYEKLPQIVIISLRNRCSKTKMGKKLFLKCNFWVSYPTKLNIYHNEVETLIDFRNKINVVHPNYHTKLDFCVEETDLVV